MREISLVNLDDRSAFSVVEAPTTAELETEARVRFLLVSGKQDDGLWGPIGALWLSEDEARGGFLVNPWALWEGSEIVRGYRSALERAWTPAEIYAYWQREVWPRGYTIDEERPAESLFLLNELVAAL
ncbi:MAG: hypothetical protein ACXWYQ_10890 [Actinomycetota bacterium]